MVFLSYDDFISGVSSNQQCEIRWGNHPYKDGTRVCLFFGSHECKNFVSGDQFLALSSIEILSSHELECKLAGVEVRITVSVNPNEIGKVLRSGIVNPESLFRLNIYGRKPEEESDNDEPETISSTEVPSVKEETEIQTVIAEPEVTEPVVTELESVPSEPEIIQPLSSDALPKKRRTRWYKPWTWGSLW